jgi:hypothetical protein
MATLDTLYSMRKKMWHPLLLVAFILGGVVAVYGQETRGYQERRANNGALQYQAIDTNEDGQFDTFYYYNAKGQLERQEIDSDHNGKIDIKIHYVDGIYIVMIEKDVDGNGSFREKKRFD